MQYGNLNHFFIKQYISITQRFLFLANFTCFEPCDFLQLLFFFLEVAKEFKFDLEKNLPYTISSASFFSPSAFPPRPNQ